MSNLKVNRHAFGMALGAIAVILHFLSWLLSIILPKNVFSIIFNAQFFGADVSSIYHLNQNVPEFLLSLIIFAVSGYLMGYIIASIYNFFNK